MENKPSDRKPKEIILEGLPGYTMTLSNVPEDVTPELLPISDEEKERLMDLRKDGVGLITSIAGNLVFYDQNRKEVNSFSSPVRLIYNFTSDDEEKRTKRKADLMEKGKLAETEDVDLIPIYLYSYTPDKGEPPEFEIWRPYQNFSRSSDNKTMSVEVRFWGDQQIGYGTKP